MNNGIFKLALIILLFTHILGAMEPDLTAKIYQLHEEGQPETYITKCVDSKAACAIQKYNQTFTAIYYQPKKQRTYNTAFRALAMIEMNIQLKEFDIQTLNCPTLPSLFNTLQQQFRQKNCTAS